MKLLRNISNFWLATLLILTCCLDVGDSGPSFEQQLKMDLDTIDAYLEDNNIDALQDPNNLIRYVIHDEGNGASPTLSNCVTTSYKGMFFDGGTFDQSTGISFPLNGVIAGWQVGMQQLQNGDSATLYIPSGLGYGTQGRPGIPANANLIFNVRLKYIGTTYDGSTGTCL